MTVATLLHTASLFVGAVSLSIPPALLPPRAVMTPQVRVYDNVGLPADDQHRALEAAAQLLGTVSVGVTWRLCPTEGQQFCQSELMQGERVVRILNSPGSPPTWEGQELGSAVLDVAKANSVLATAYANRIEWRATGCGVEPFLLLGRVIAHELRHILSSEVGHSRRGLMREMWTCSELRLNRPEDWSFLAADRSAILKSARRETR
jgi:hypothetical protein